MAVQVQTQYVRWLKDLSIGDVSIVGGKNASLGEMISNLQRHGIRIPEGFATTAEAYRQFVTFNHIDGGLRETLDKLRQQKISLPEAGKAIRHLFLAGKFSEAIEHDILEMYRELGQKYNRTDVDVAVRSSATAEDLPTASFAGQQESFLNVSGHAELLDACRRCYASLFTDRAIAYREAQGFDHLKVALSIGVQKMVRSDKAGAGVMFTLDTETGFPRVVLINADWGLGENVVQGAVTPDEYMVFKPLLKHPHLEPIIEKKLGIKEKTMIYATDGTKATTVNIDTPYNKRDTFVLSNHDILTLARWGCIIEEHYKRPMDIEWAKDGELNELFIVQARPETVESQRQKGVINNYTLLEKGKTLLTGLSIGNEIATGKVQVICRVEDINRFIPGSILVTVMTDPDWVPILQKAKGIITNRGGRTCHAAIVAREFGIPAIVGCGDATEKLEDGQEITLSCAEGDQGYVYQGQLKFQETTPDLAHVPQTKTKIMMNIGSPFQALRWWRLPVDGIGLARMEFIITNLIKIHPMALVFYDTLRDKEAQARIKLLTRGYPDKSQYFVEKLARGIAEIAASQHPNPVIVRMSDFKTNEYANLIGGKEFELKEDNPMLGFRGASRYYSPQYREGFALECKALKLAREKIGLDNIILMIPFCRTLEEADKVLEELAKNNLARHQNGLQVYMMCEIPSNIILVEDFARRFDGFSIGSNDLTQLVLGVDRDSELLSHLFDERNEAVKEMIAMLIHKTHQTHTKVGLCGQAPSDYPEFAGFLVEQGIDSISLNPDSVIAVKKRVAEVEKRLNLT